jgi:ribonuclease P protein component
VRRSRVVGSERRWLAERRVAREDGRPARFVQQDSFSLMVWPLVLHSPSDPYAGAERGRHNRRSTDPDPGPGADAKTPSTSPADESLLDTADSLPSPPSGAPQRGAKSPWCPKVLSPSELREVLTWSYIARVRVSKQVLGKRAVVRNRAQRRLRAALSTVCPERAARGVEYVFTVFPAALITPFAELVRECEDALKECSCFVEGEDGNGLPEEGKRRPRYSKSLR